MIVIKGNNTLVDLAADLERKVGETGGCNFFDADIRGVREILHSETWKRCQNITKGRFDAPLVVNSLGQSNLVRGVELLPSLRSEVRCELNTPRAKEYIRKIKTHDRWRRGHHT